MYSFNPAPPNGITFGSVCSGIEAASVAGEPLGWRAAWFSEIEPFPSAVLAHHFPHVQNLGDMTKLLDLDVEVIAPDILCGGCPCQAFSMSGNRKSLEDARGNLTLVFCNLADGLDEGRASLGLPATVIFYENVPGILNTPDNAFGCFLGAMAGEDDALVAPGGKWPNAGYVLGPKRKIAWRVLDAQHFGVAQRRRRVFVIASAREGFDPREVLFECEGVRGDPAPGTGPGEGPASGAADGVGISGEHAAVSSGRGWWSQASEKAAMICRSPAPQTNTLIPEQVVAHVDTMPTMTSGGPSSTSHNQTSGQMRDQYIVPVVDQTLHMTERGRDGGRSLELSPVVPALRVRSGGGSSDRDMLFDPVEAEVRQGMRVRRLTPTECERLQGFPDGWTRIPWKKKTAEECPDGPRYKALGNSWAVPCVAWIFRRLNAALTGLVVPSQGVVLGGEGGEALAFHHNAQACQLPGLSRDTRRADALTRSQGAAVVEISPARFAHFAD